jgi:DNA primase
MALPENFIYQLKQNNPIDSVMSSYVRLQRRGHNYLCLCPFHSEKTPSCTIYNDTQSFYCFGCGAGGDVITFIMKIENLEYIEAVKLLAERTGMRMPDEALNNDFTRIKSRILEINRLAAKYFYNVLTVEKDGEKGRRYFEQRQLSSNTIKKYGLGYAPNDWFKLSNYLKAAGYSDDELIIANLCAKGKNGGLYDLFRDRVIFPIIDLRGNVVAFGGRIIDGEGPKYLNSSDTPMFKKSRNLFSLNFAKKSDSKKLILAEGYMDVISINQAGFENVVATLGTALTHEQARLMRQYAEEVIISYDSDGAGQAATHKAINLLSEIGVNTRIIKMEGAKDPDEYIKKFGALKFKHLLDNSEGAINFELEKCRNGIDIETDTGKIEYLKRCVNVLADITSPIEREVYISKLAAEQRILKETLIQQVNGVIKKRMYSDRNKEWTEIRMFSKQAKAVPESLKNPRKYKAETGIIAYLNSHPDSVDYIASRLQPDCFVTEFNRNVYNKLIDGIKKSEYFNIMSLQSELTADEMGKITEILTINRSVDINETAVNDFINILTENDYNTDKNVKDFSEEEFRKYTENLRKKK